MAYKMRQLILITNTARSFKLMVLASYIVAGLLLNNHFAMADNSAKAPSMPYLDWGSCPFECCTYQAWTATTPIKAYKTRDETSEIVFHLKANEQVQAITGVVVTHQFGKTKTLKPVNIGYNASGKGPLLSLKPGEIIYSLHYAGEGFEVFWYQGNTYTDDISMTNANTFKTLSTPTYVWWAKIKNNKGKIGWTKKTKQFKNQDACG